MPRKPINYANTIIYVIRSLADPTLIYVGSTTDYNNRKRKHKNSCKSSQLKLYIMIRANGDWDNFVMVEHSKYPCENNRQAEKEEERVRLELQANLNTRRAFATPEEIVEDQKEYKKLHKVEILEYQKEYAELHKVEILEYKKEYYEENKVEILEKHKKYNELHKEEILVKAKEYYEEKKEELNEKHKEYYELHKVDISEKHKEKITCDCGCIVTKGSIYTHRKTQKHINLLKNK